MYYPGDDYVDIVGLDVYVDDPVFSSKFIFIKKNIFIYFRI